MPVSRSTQLLTMRDYVTSVALVPAETHFTNLSPAAGPVAPWPAAVSEWAFIPIFQRGIAWTREDVGELVSSSSEVLGSTVWGRFPWSFQPFDPAPSPQNPALNYYPVDAIYLTDGLQRFTIATAILVSLDKLNVFGNGTLASSLSRLSNSLSPIQLQVARFNHHVLANYPRPALAHQYLEFFADIEQWVDSEKSKATWLENVQRFFLDRQVGVDIYTGFSGPSGLASNFVGINTGSQQLGMVDIFRAQIIEHGLVNGWSSTEALSFDTDLSQVLVQADFAGRISPLITQMGRLATTSNSSIAALPSLRANASAALKTETGELLERLEPYTEPTAPVNPYQEPAVDEVFRCGKLPLSLLAAWDLGAATQPWYLQQNASPPADELIVFVRAVYRLYIAGLEGRQTELLVDLLAGTNRPASIFALADKLSRAATTGPLGATRGIDQPVERDWLAYLLQGIPKRRAARVFTACELPESFDPAGMPLSTRPSQFAPTAFGTRAAELQVDHLIPASTGGGSDPAEETLRNFAPIPTALNRAVGTLPCDTKLLGGAGIPARYHDLAAGHYVPSRGGAPVSSHPYIVWLQQTHAPGHTATELNDKQALRSAVGDQRMSWFTDRLMSRL